MHHHKLCTLALLSSSLLTTSCDFIWSMATSASAATSTANELPISTIAGIWQGDGISLTISDDGTVVYERSGGGSSSSLAGLPLSGLTSTGFDVKVFGVGTHFAIDKLPHDVDGVTKMSVDGFELTKRTTPLPVTSAAHAAVDADAAEERAPLPVKVAADTVLPAAGTLSSIVGVWAGKDTRLTIGDDGAVSYAKSGVVRRKLGGTATNVTATGFDLEMIGGLRTHFVIDRGPAIVDGVITMTVDGVVLQRS